MPLPFMATVSPASPSVKAFSSMFTLPAPPPASVWPLRFRVPSATSRTEPEAADKVTVPVRVKMPETVSVPAPMLPTVPVPEMVPVVPRSKFTGEALSTFTAHGVQRDVAHAAAVAAQPGHGLERAVEVPACAGGDVHRGGRGQQRGLHAGGDQGQLAVLNEDVAHVHGVAVGGADAGEAGERGGRLQVGLRPGRRPGVRFGGGPVGRPELGRDVVAVGHQPHPVPGVGAEGGWVGGSPIHVVVEQLHAVIVLAVVVRAAVEHQVDGVTVVAPGQCPPRFRRCHSPCR